MRPCSPEPGAVAQVPGARRDAAADCAPTLQRGLGQGASGRDDPSSWVGLGTYSGGNLEPWRFFEVVCSKQEGLCLVLQAPWGSKQVWGGSHSTWWLEFNELS